jgi:hypothetical protein
MNTAILVYIITEMPELLNVVDQHDCIAAETKLRITQGLARMMLIKKVARFERFEINRSRTVISVV